MKRGNIIHSLVVKLAFLFLCIIWISSILVGIGIRSIVMPRLDKDIGVQMINQARMMRRLTDNGDITSDGLKILSRDSEIIPRLVTDIQETADRTGKSFEEMDSLIQRAEMGGIIINRNHRGPFCLVLIGDQMFILTANLSNNRTFHYLRGVQSALFFGAILGSILTVGASIWIVRRIRKISLATQEVARGNFEIRLDETSKDELGQFARDFNQMVRELQSNEYLRKDFISSVSHELKTPISSIQGFARIIRKSDIPREQLEEYADVIIRETDRLSNLSANLLYLSELESTNIPVKANTFSLDEQLRSVLLLLERSWTEKDLNLEVDLECLDYNGNEELLYQVWLNLIQNAIKFSRHGGVLVISMRKKGPYIRVYIRDTGIGMDEDVQARAFERFFQGDNSRSHEGSGLGLSIVKKIVDLVNGHIKLESKPGEGSIFTVDLPI